MTELPDQWKKSTLGEVAKWGSGGTPSAGNAKYYDGDIPWAIIGDLDDSVVTKTAKSITKMGLDNSSAKIVPVGAILIAMYGSIGKLGIAGFPMATNQAIAFAVPDETKVLKSYLFHYLRSQRELFLWNGKGATQQNISQTFLKSWEIPIPPIVEQRKIVELLEDQLSRLDTAMVDVEEASKNAQRLERAVLFNLLENGKKEIGSSWTIAKIKDVLQQDKSGSMLGQGWSPQCDSEAALEELQWGSLKTTAVQYGEFDWRFNKLLPPHLEPRPNLEIEAGDFLITRLGPRNRCGVICRVKSTKQRILLPDKMFRFRPNLEILDPQFFEYFLISPQSIEILNTLKTGGSESGMNITQERFLNFEVYFPTLSEQARLVKNVEESISLAKHARVSLSNFSSSSRALRYSLLQAAFTGQLTKEVVSV